MKADRAHIEAVNHARQAHDVRQAVIDQAWQIPWDGHCLAVECRRRHNFSVAIAIAHNDDGAMPHARIALWEDLYDLAIPIPKHALAELITDLTQCLNELP